MRILFALSRFSTISKRRLRGLWPIRSARLGFSLAYGVVFALSAALFLSAIWLHYAGTIEREARHTVVADANELRATWSEYGIEALRRAIEERIAQDVDEQAVYLLCDAKGQIVVGNLAAWPPEMTKATHFKTLKLTREGVSSLVMMHAFAIPGHYRLLVGRDIRGRTLLRRVLGETFVWSWLMVTTLVLGGAWAVRDIFQRLLTAIARTTSAIANGDMHQRMPLFGNEIDLVSQTINLMLERITRLMEGVKEVSNSIAHDLRTPITRARNRLEDASLHATTTEEMHEAIQRAAADLDHITALFDALLRIAQIEAGARRAAFETRDLVYPLRDIADLYDASAEEKGLKLTVELPEELPFFGDTRLIQQAVANLLDNAIKFSPNGSTIDLFAQINGANLRISVSDSGPGMPEADLARATERFFRADQARHTPGVGLGLALVQAIAHLHDGTLQLEPLEQGLRVSLIMPIPATRIT